MPDRPTSGRSISPQRYVCLGMVLILVLGGAGQIRGQSETQLRLDPNRPIKQFIFDTWRVEDGLPQNVVKAILQTEEGYMWIATQAGLARFDGVRFTIFDKANTPALASNEIESLLERRNGDLWIGTNGGGLIRRTADGSFHAFDTDDGFTGTIVLSLHQDSRGNVWLGTAGRGLYRYDGTVFTRFTRAEGLPSNSVLAVASDTDGSLWIGTQRGLARLEAGEVTRTWLSDYPITDLHRSEPGRVWAGTHGGGLCRVSRADADPQIRCMTPSDGLSSNIINTILEDSAGALWIGTKGGGINRLYKGTIDVFGTADGLPNSKVSALFQDRENSLWIGTSGGGITRLRGSKFRTYSTSTGLSHNVVLTVLEDRAGTLWFGTDGGGLNRLSDRSSTHMTTVEDVPSDHIYSLHEGDDGRVWAGLLNQGLCVVAGGTPECHTTEDGLSSNTVYSIYDDGSGNLWIGTDRGVNRLHDNDITSYTQDDGLPHNWVTAIHEDRNGVLWIGTFGGLVAYADSSFTTYTANNGLTSETILAIHEDAADRLWVGTKGGGVCRRRGENSFRCYTADDGLLTDNVLQVQTDAQGRLWTGHLTGIASVPIEQLDALDSGSRNHLEPDVFGPVEANGGAQPAAWRSQDGHLWFATMSGAVTVDPANIPRNTVPPPVHIEEVLVEEQYTDLRRSPSLPPESKDFEFHYTGLSFVAPDEVTFAYKLEGYDQQWVDAGSRRRAYYTNVPAGEYTFRVKAFNNAGIPSRTAASVDFTVEPFFYQTYWFYGLCTLGVIFLSLAGNHLRVRRLRAQRRKLSKLVDEQTEQLRQREQELKSLNADLEEEVQRKVDTIMTERLRYEQELIAAKQKAEESARLKSNILTNMSHEIRTPLTSIMGFVDVLSHGVSEEEFDEFTHLIQKSGDRLLKTIDSVLNMSELKAGSIEVNAREVDAVRQVRQAVEDLESKAHDKGIALEYEFESTPLRSHVDPEHLRRAVKHLVSNAIKFSDRGTVTVRAHADDGEAVIEVEDDGQGIDETFMPHLFEAFKQESSGDTRTHDGIGLGLTITRHLVELMNATIDVESEKGAGSCFTLRLPHGRPQNEPRTQTTKLRRT